MARKRVIIFDFDGVISDSLQAHLRFVKDIFKYFEIPAKVHLTRSFGRKIAVTPLAKFVRNIAMKSKIDLSDDIVNKIIAKYEERFILDYETNYFKGIDTMLEDLNKKDECVLAIVSVNVLNNIKCILGPHFHYFAHILTLDNFQGGKAEKIQEIIKREKVDLSQVLFVGDMRSDYEASKDVGVKFCGVRYGWGKFSKREEFTTVGSVRHLKRLLLTSKTDGKKKVKTENKLAAN